MAALDAADDNRSSCAGDVNNPKGTQRQPSTMMGIASAVHDAFVEGWDGAVACTSALGEAVAIGETTASTSVLDSDTGWSSEGTESQDTDLSPSNGGLPTQRRRRLTRKRMPSSKQDVLLEEDEEEEAEMERSESHKLGALKTASLSPRRKNFRKWLILPAEIAQDLKERQEKVKRAKYNMQERIKRSMLIKQQGLATRVEKVLSKVKTGRARRIRHKFVFDCSMADIILMAFILGKAPHQFYLYFSVKMVALMFIRLPIYTVNKQQYYLFDFCYYTNLVVLGYIWLLPHVAWLHDAVSACTGLMLISIKFFRNSAVFHDFERLTTWYVHVMPSLVMWTLQWYASEEHFARLPSEQRSVFPGLCLYFTWAVGYFLNIFVVSKSTIHERGFETLYKLTAIDLGYIKRFPKKWQRHGPLLFMACHCILFLVGLPFYKMGFYLQTVLMLLAIMSGIHNGGRYYVDYFWKCYERNAALYLDVALDALDQKGSENGSQASTDFTEDKKDS